MGGGRVRVFVMFWVFLGVLVFLMVLERDIGKGLISKDILK